MITRLVDIKNVKTAFLGKTDLDEATLQSIIDELPTAYDVDEVVTQLAEVPNHYFIYSHNDLISESDAVKIVKTGGLDKLN